MTTPEARALDLVARVIRLLGVAGLVPLVLVPDAVWPVWVEVVLVIGYVVTRDAQRRVENRSDRNG